MCNMLRYLKEKRRYVFSSIKSYTQIYHYLCIYFECQIPIYDNVMHVNPMRPMMI